MLRYDPAGGQVTAGRLKPGDRVGEYVVEAVLGSGAFGTVYSGVQPVIGKLVAIKVLQREDPETTSRFINEARAVNAIRHPNLVDIFAFGQLGDGRSYLVMEWLEGEPMDAYLERIGGRVPAESMPAIVSPLARAIDAAHAAGIIHRDLKPSNVFLSVNAEGSLVPKLLDFGIAKLVAGDVPNKHETGTGHVLGTPEYMAPEQCEGPNIDHRADVYSFGAMMFRMLTGSPPFQAATAVELMMKHMKEEPPRPSVVFTGVPRGVDASILAMLEKSPERRPPDLETAVAAFEAALGASGLSAEPPPLVEPKKIERRAFTLTEPGIGPSVAVRPARSGLIAGLGVAAVAAAALPFLLNFGTEPAQPPPARAPPPKEVPPPPAPPSRATIRFGGVPDGTNVLDPSGRLLATTPGALELERSEAPIELRLEKPGFLREVVRVTPNESQLVNVVLRADVEPPPTRRPPPTKAAPDKDSVEDPY
jgi:serine/threonine-protein kinase